MEFLPPTQQELAQIIREYLVQNRLMTLATCDKNAIPWASTVLFAFDAQCNFYFVSEITTRHAQNILETGRAAAAINKRNIENRKVVGAQFEGGAAIVSEGEALEAAYPIMAERHRWVREYLASKDKDAPRGLQGASLSLYPHNNANRIFKITPQKILYIDDTRFPKATRVELLMS